MKVLDLGCGIGLTPQKLDLPSAWQITGLDVSYSLVAKAHVDFPDRSFVCAAAEYLPFPDGCFDRVVSNVALPYTDIPKTVAEAYRILIPDGIFLASLHHAGFTLGELRKALPNPKASLYRVWVLVNGIIFHIFGRALGESFQTERGIRIALRHANFVNVVFRHDSKRWFVEARKR
ncbi:MAG: methyltransferase domain-containing protein [Candidatus Sulfotelmatobacter sp.]